MSLIKGLSGKTVPLIGMVFSLAISFMSQPALCYSKEDDNAINNFIARQERIHKAKEYRGARKIARGALNGDGKENRVVLYTLESFGGTNLYLQYLAVFVNRGGKLFCIACQRVGGKNRRAINSISIEKEKIILQTEEYLPTDPSCCPSKKGQTQYILNKGRLKEIQAI